jgi:hypothetical protein
MPACGGRGVCAAAPLVVALSLPMVALGRSSGADWGACRVHSSQHLRVEHVSTGRHGHTSRVYAVGLPEGAELSALYAMDGQGTRVPLELWAEPGERFFQAEVGSLFGSDINPALFQVVPDLAVDTWLTLGSDTIADGLSLSSTSGFDESDVDFTTQGGNLTVADGAVFATRCGSPALVVPADGEILLGQVTTPGNFGGTLNLQYLEGGVDRTGGGCEIIGKGEPTVVRNMDFSVQCETADVPYPPPPPPESTPPPSQDHKKRSETCQEMAPIPGDGAHDGCVATLACNVALERVSGDDERGVTWRVYVTGLPVDSELSALYAVADGPKSTAPLSLWSDARFYQSPYGAFLGSDIPSNLPPSIEVGRDSWLTLAVDSNAAGVKLNTVGIDSGRFEQAGGNLSSADGAIFGLRGTHKGALVVGNDGRALVAQVTTTSERWGGSLNLQYLTGGIDPATGNITGHATDWWLLDLSWDVHCPPAQSHQPVPPPSAPPAGDTSVAAGLCKPDSPIPGDARGCSSTLSCYVDVVRVSSSGNGLGDVWRVYATQLPANAELSALYSAEAGTSPTSPITLWSSHGFFQSPLGAPVGSDISAALEHRAGLSEDSWLTLAVDSDAAGLQLQHIGLEFGTFEAGGNFSASDGAIFATRQASPQLMVGDEGRALLAQLTVNGSFGGSLSLHYFTGEVEGGTLVGQVMRHEVRDINWRIDCPDVGPSGGGGGGGGSSQGGGGGAGRADDDEPTYEITDDGADAPPAPSDGPAAGVVAGWLLGVAVVCGAIGVAVIRYRRGSARQQFWNMTGTANPLAGDGPNRMARSDSMGI